MHHDPVAQPRRAFYCGSAQIYGAYFPNGNAVIRNENKQSTLVCRPAGHLLFLPRGLSPFSLGVPLRGMGYGAYPKTDDGLEQKLWRQWTGEDVPKFLLAKTGRITS